MNFTDEIRNTAIPLGIGRANLTRKYLVVSVFSILIALLYKSIIVNYIQSMVLDFVMVSVIIGLVSLVYEKLYIRYQEKISDGRKNAVLITHSNKVYLLQGDKVMNETDCDEIRIRPVDTSRDDTYKGYSSVVECIRDNKIILAYAICRLKEYENTILFPNPDRVDEDIKINYN